MVATASYEHRAGLKLCLRSGSVLSGKRPRPSLGAFAAALPPVVLLARPPGAARLSLRLIERLGFGGDARGPWEAAAIVKRGMR